MSTSKALFKSLFFKDVLLLSTLSTKLISIISSILKTTVI